MSPAHMHPVRDYFVYIDPTGNIWKLEPRFTYGTDFPFTVTLLHKA